MITFREFVEADLKFKGKEMKSHLDKMLAKYKRGENIGATALARLKARGLYAS